MVVAWLAGRIREGRPTSLVRLGDGEGAFLRYEERLADAQPDDQEQYQRAWWGGARLSAADAARQADLLIEALRGADAIGVPPVSGTSGPAPSCRRRRAGSVRSCTPSARSSRT
jgi:hypothetical protein